MFDTTSDNRALTPEALTPYTCVMDQDIADEELMLLYQQGDAAAFEMLYLRHKGPVYRYILRQCGELETVNELFQDVWMKLIQNRGGYEVKAKFTTWLYTIARHRIIDYYRQAGKRAYEAEEKNPDTLSAAEYEQPDVQFELQQQVESLSAAVKSLPVLQRDVFLLKEEAGMDLEEIATLTGVNKETVKSRLRYAVKKLKQVMKP